MGCYAVVGFLTLPGLLPIFGEVAPHISAEEIRTAFNELDEVTALCTEVHSQNSA